MPILVILPNVRAHVVDPSAFTPPYDHALCGALARAGAEAELITSRFAYGPVPRGDGYAVREFFYRHAAGAPASRLRLATKLAQHLPDMLRYRRAARAADVVHYQWLSVQQLDARILPPRRPRLITAHDVIPREPRPGQIAGQKRLYERMDAVVVHSEHGRGRLVSELGLDPALVHVIPHGVFDYLTRLSEEEPLPAELAAVEKPVVLWFGLIRPYKGLDVLLEAWRGIDDAELWVVGMPRMPLEPFREAAPPGVRFVPRFVTDPELPAFFRRADLVVLPYREIDQSGVLFSALAFGKPLVLSAVGGFPEVAATGAGELVPPDDAGALHDAIAGLLAAPERRAQLARAAHAAAQGGYAWDTIGERTLELYRALLARG